MAPIIWDMDHCFLVVHCSLAGRLALCGPPDFFTGHKEAWVIVDEIGKGWMKSWCMHALWYPLLRSRTLPRGHILPQFHYFDNHMFNRKFQINLLMRDPSWFGAHLILGAPVYISRCLTMSRKKRIKSKVEMKSTAWGIRQNAPKITRSVPSP